MNKETGREQSREVFGHLASGEAIERVHISGGGLRTHILSWGAVIQDLRLDGHAAPLMLGFDDFSSYLENPLCFGATAGRYANRIEGGRFEIDGQRYQLECNERGVTHIHGGNVGVDQRNWSITALGDDFVTLTLHEPEGYAGYPGNCTMTCTYSLPGDGTLSVLYETVSDAATPANLCQHSYFILDDGKDTLDHEIQIRADHYLPTDVDQIPTGEVRPVAGTAFDLRQWTPLRRQLEEGGEIFDHNFCLSPERQVKRSVAKVRSQRSGVSMEVLTTEPGVQLYTAPDLDPPVPGLGGRRYRPFGGVCLETQIWPDSVNRDHFPNAVLRPGRVLRQETDYVFRKT